VLNKKYNAVLEKDKMPSPCYVLEEKKLRDNLTRIKYVAEMAGVEIILALKGYALWKTFPIIKEYVTRCAASSSWEAQLAWEEMKTPVHACCAAYSKQEFKEILPLSSHITFNSIEQFEQFFPLVKHTRAEASCGLRINPEYSPIKEAVYNPTLKGSRLGVVRPHLPATLPEGIEGLHFHVLCESNSYDFEQTLDVIERDFGEYFSEIRWINFGGGHLISHKDYDVSHLISVLRNFKVRHPHLHIILEPGSAFVWDAGFLRTTVLDIIKNHDTRTAIIDASFTCHMPDCLEMPYKPVIRGAVFAHPHIILPNGYIIGGNSCLAGDVISEPYYFNHALEPGETLIFEDMLHYTTVKTTFFNGVPHPSLALLNDKDELKILRTFTYRDYRSRMS
jgi:carboxynorspermidine decarboxylase